MRNSVLTISALAALAAIPAAASANPVSGGAAVDSEYVFSDLYVQNEGPTAKVWVNFDTESLGLKGCSIDFFGAQGIEKNEHSELDAGGSCRFDLGKTTKVEVSASRYVLAGLADITTLEGKVSHGRIDLTVTEYLVEDGEPDATKIELGYTIEPAKRLSLRGLMVYEHGFGLDDIYVGGAEARYAVSNKCSITGAFYAPIHRSAGDPRDAQGVAGFSCDF